LQDPETQKEDGMATRAERFKSTTARQRDGQGADGAGAPAGKKRHQPSRAKRLQQAAAPGDRRYGGASTAARNMSKGKKAIYKLEETRAPLTPSRKSSRGGKNRVKAATPLTSRQKLRVTSPTQQHARGR
jgi:hypothetical protein